MLNTPQQEYKALIYVEPLIDKNDDVVMRQMATSCELILKLILLDVEARMQDISPDEYQNFCSETDKTYLHNNAEALKKMGHKDVLDLWKNCRIIDLWRAAYKRMHYPPSFSLGDLGEIYRFCNPAKHGHRCGEQKPKSTKLQKMFYTLKDLLEEGFPEIDFAEEESPVPKDIKHNLPRKPRNFIGRSDELKRLLHHVSLDDRSYYICISGMGGVGKSTLAVEMASQCLELGKTQRAYQYDYIFWATAKERHYLPNQSKMTRQEKLFNKASIIAEMSSLFFKETKLMDEAEQERRVFSLLRSNPVLLIIDNAEDVKDESLKIFLRDIPQPSKVVSTDRISAPEATSFELTGLNKDDTIKLIGLCREQHGGTQLSSSDLDFIYEFSNGIPLLIEQVIVHLKNGTHLSSINEKIANPQKSDLSQYLFAEEYQKVSTTSQYILKALASVGVDSVHGKVLCELVGLDENSFEESANELSRHSLLLVDSKLMPVIEQQISILPIFRNYIQTFLSNTNVSKNIISNLCMQLTTREEDKDWVSVQAINFIEENVQIFEWAVDDAFSRKDHLFVIQLVRYTLYALDVRGLHSTRNFICKLGIQSAEFMKRHRDNAYFHIQGLAWDNFQKGNYESASKDIEKALEISSDKFTTAIANRLQGLIHKENCRYKEAERLLIQSKESFLKLGKKKLLSITYGSLGSCAREMNELQQSEKYMIQASKALEGTQNSEELASIFSQKLCKLYISNSMLDKAEKHLENSYVHLKKINRPLGFAYYKHYKALICEGRGYITAAYDLCLEAEDLFQRYGNKQEIKADMERIKCKYESLS